MWTPTIALLPGALTIYLGFDGGGYFPPATGVACAALTLALVLRLTLADRPLEGFGLAAALATATLGLFAAWSIVSSSWSDAPARAVAEFDRALLYMLMLALLATLPRTTQTARTVMIGIAAGATFVCLGGLLSRVLPDVFEIAPNVLDERLSYPITYWNGLGLLAAITIVLATHLTCSAREHPAARVAGAAVLPLLAATLYFTFSRASIVVMAIGVVAYVVLARPRAFVPALVAVLPTAAIAVIWAYNAELLARPNPTTDAAAEEGHEVFLVLVLCALAAALARYLLIRAGADRWLDAIDVPRRTRNIVVVTAAGVLLLGAGSAWAAFDVGDRIERQYERFKDGDVIPESGDTRDRLTTVANNGRLDHWNQALDAWDREPFKGTGAGTYELTWAEHRSSVFTVRDGHSLYLETLSEVGLVGGVLLVLVLGGLLAALAARSRGTERALWAAMLTAAGVWALHAAQDWVWELPAVTSWLFAAGGIALARPPGEQAAASRLIAPPRLARVIAALVVLALTVTPVLNAIADARVRDSVAALKQGDCAGAIDDALAATSALGARPEPYAVLGFCDVRLGKTELAERMMRNAIDRDPRNWVYHYGLALVRAAGGRDPSEAVAAARRLNPKEPAAIEAEAIFGSTNDPRKWRRRALEARLPIQ
jgi:O-antigen ligase